MELPATEAGADSRQFTVAMAHLPPGHYDLWLETPDASSGRLPVTVVSWQRRSPFLVHSMSGCTASWPTSDEGLDLLEKAGLEMVSATGPWSQLNAQHAKA